MIYAKTCDDTLYHIVHCPVGRTFRDHGGNAVEVLTDQVIAVGVGYNAILPIAEYASALEAGETFGRYVVPGFDRRKFLAFAWA